MDEQINQTKSNLKMTWMQGRLPAGGDAEERRGPQRDDHVARSEERGTSHMDQSVFATMWRNWKNGGTPSALHLAANT